MGGADDSINPATGAREFYYDGADYGGGATPYDFVPDPSYDFGGGATPYDFMPDPPAFAPMPPKEIDSLRGDLESGEPARMVAASLRIDRLGADAPLLDSLARAIPPELLIRPRHRALRHA